MKPQARTAKSPQRKAAARDARPSRSAPAAGADKVTGEAKPIDAEQRRAMIAQAAYFRAEKRGFAPGAELQDWLAAEAEIDRQFGGQPLLEHQLAHSDT